MGDFNCFKKSFKLKTKTQKKLQISVLVLAYIALQITMAVFARKQEVGFNGIFAALQYGLCLMMVLVSNRSGTRIALALMGISTLFVLRAILFAGELTAVQGLANLIFYMVTILLLARYHKKRELENITDYLTGMLNRKGLYKDLKSRIDDKRKFSIIYFNLDNFKFINDNYGHAYGDELLRKITRRLGKKLGPKDKMGRTSGSELLVIVDEIDKREELANEFLEIIRQKATLVVNQIGVDCYPTCYAGVASYPMDGLSAETLIKYADIATFEAGVQKSQTAQVFSTGMVSRLNRQIELEKLIKEGLEKDYFYLVYQPQYKLENKGLIGFEALLRMKTPAGEFVSPGEFIPVAERSDLILQVDQYVMHRVMKEFGPVIETNPALLVSVNVSAKNVCSADFTDKVNALLTETGFPPHNLEIEITEYCMVDSMGTTIENIRKLREMGIQVALDDFGTGYTSLNYVAKLPINLLKVDKSIIDDITKGSKNRDFVQAVISMGHLMGCEVIAEGVEEEQQLLYLGEHRCDFIQGYVWGKPMDYDAAKALVNNNRYTLCKDDELNYSMD